MSYSFNITAKDKTEAKQRASENLDAQTKGQPGHDCDRETVRAAIVGMIDALGDNPDRDVRIECYGHASGVWDDGKVTETREAGVTIKASTVERVTA
jgi:hypothetical protein